MNLVRIASTALFLLLWWLISREDRRFQKVKNKDLLAAFLLVTGFYCIIAIRSAPLLKELAFNASAGLSCALGLWFLGTWPAGDAKLYLLLSLLFPLLYESFAAPALKLSLIILINIFIPAALFYFFKAAQHLWETRLSHSKRLLGGGWEPARDLLWTFLRQSASAASAFALETGRSFRTLGFWEDTFHWLATLIAASLLCLRYKETLHSSFLMSLTFSIALIAWSKVSGYIGRHLSFLVSVALLAALVSKGWAADAALGFFVARISLFGVCLYLGLKGSRWLLQGRSELLIVIGVISLLMPALMTLVNRLGFDQWRQLLLLCFLGLFFGLALILVRIMDAETHLNISVDELPAFALLAPSFLERMRADAEFFSAHFASLYADGLTREQVIALQAWCRRRAISQVELAPTVSFAPWIFAGFALTWWLRAPVLQFLF